MHRPWVPCELINFNLVYILCSKEVQEKFIAEAKDVLKEWYGDNIQSSPDLSRVINANNFQWVILVNQMKDLK